MAIRREKRTTSTARMPMNVQVIPTNTLLLLLLIISLVHWRKLQLQMNHEAKPNSRCNSCPTEQSRGHPIHSPLQLLLLPCTRPLPDEQIVDTDWTCGGNMEIALHIPLVCLSCDSNLLFDSRLCPCSRLNCPPTDHLVAVPTR